MYDVICIVLTEYKAVDNSSKAQLQDGTVNIEKGKLVHSFSSLRLRLAKF